MAWGRSQTIRQIQSMVRTGSGTLPDLAEGMQNRHDSMFSPNGSRSGHASTRESPLLVELRA